MSHSNQRRTLLKSMAALGALGSLGLLSACRDRAASAAVRQESIASNLLTTTPDNQAATYRHVNQLGYTRLITRGDHVLPLPVHSTNLATLKYDFAGKTYSIDEYMARNRTSGLLILKNGERALERYAMGNDEHSKWTSFSVAKSVTATLVGLALKDGLIKSIDDRLTTYLPELKGSAYEQNTIQQLLSMRSGVRWIEDYTTTGDSDIARFAEAVSTGKKGVVMELMRTRPRAAAPGSVFNYSTGESYVLGALVAAATGNKLSQYLSKKIWAPLGMEADGYWALDSEYGLELGGDNFSATLRDYGRFGQFILNDGIIDGNKTLPTGWRDLAGSPDNPVTAYGKLYPDYPLGYGYQWWAFPPTNPSKPTPPSFTAEGIFGQFMTINPAENLVVVVWSAWTQSWNDQSEQETYALINSAIAALKS